MTIKVEINKKNINLIFILYKNLIFHTLLLINCNLYNDLMF